MVAPLEDVTVIEIDNWMASPSAGAILADLGANVIKVEPLTGDPMRDMGRPAKVPEDKKGFDYQFDVSNRGKRSIAVDLESGPGLDVVLRLVATGRRIYVQLVAASSGTVWFRSDRYQEGE